ncbi:hypothetical protein LWM68_45060 [Niabella sp. W65]|nr:hypothetical protein [Niabella sp. W65]MCH7369275.1 hypothetical protein [Niabella sp. W65]
MRSIENILKANKLSVTAGRQKILQLFLNSGEPLLMQISKKMPESTSTG